MILNHAIILTIIRFNFFISIWKYAVRLTNLLLSQAFVTHSAVR